MRSLALRLLAASCCWWRGWGVVGELPATSKGTLANAPAAAAWVALAASPAEPVTSEDGADDGEEPSNKDHTEEGKHHNLDKVSVTMATMFFIMLLSSVGLVHFAQASDEHLRKSAYTMMSVTVSVFLAVVVYLAWYQFWTIQVWEGQNGRGLGMGRPTPLLKAAFGLLNLIVFWVGMNRLAWASRMDARVLYCITCIGAHISAFAGIYFADEVQDLFAGQVFHATDQIKPLLCTLGCVWALFTVLRPLSWSYRLWLRGSAHPMTNDPSTEAEDVKECRCMFSAFGKTLNSENECMAMVGSYIIVKIVCWVVLKRSHKLHDGKHEAEPELKNILKLAGFGLFFVVMLAFRKNLPQNWKKLITAAIDFLVKEKTCGAPLRGFHRGLWRLFLDDILTMSMCWCFLKSSLWMSDLTFKKFTLGLISVVDAFLVSVASIICIVVLDGIADKAQQDQPRDSRAIQEAEEGADEMLERILEEDAKEVTPEWQALEVAMKEIKDQADKTTSEVMRVCINGLGMLVAMSWDHAFEHAEATVVEWIMIDVPFCNGHPVVLRGVLAVVMCMFVAPTWARFLAPLALRGVKDFKRDVERDEENHRRFREGEYGHDAEDHHARTLRHDDRIHRHDPPDLEGAGVLGGAAAPAGGSSTSLRGDGKDDHELSSVAARRSEADAHDPPARDGGEAPDPSAAPPGGSRKGSSTSLRGDGEVHDADCSAAARGEDTHEHVSPARSGADVPEGPAAPPGGSVKPPSTSFRGNHQAHGSVGARPSETNDRDPSARDGARAAAPPGGSMKVRGTESPDEADVASPPTRTWPAVGQRFLRAASNIGRRVPEGNAPGVPDPHTEVESTPLIVSTDAAPTEEPEGAAAPAGGSPAAGTGART